MHVYLWHGEEWKLITWQATEHMNITKHMYIDGSFSVCSAKCTNVAYISANVNIVKISILIVSRQRHSSWNRLRAAVLNALDVLKLSVTTLSENRFRQLSVCDRELNESFKLIREPIHCFANCFYQAFEQNCLKRMNHSRMDIAHCPEKSKLHVWNKLKHFYLVLQ